MKFLSYLVPSVLLSLCLISGAGAVPVDPESKDAAPSVPELANTGYHLVFSDEFNGNSLDLEKWGFRTDSKMWSTQKPENVSLSHGTLLISLKKEVGGSKPYSGGGIITKQAFRFGYYEARLKTPRGSGWHTSFWMMKYNPEGSPASDAPCQELDVIENDSSRHDMYSVNVHRWKGGHVWLGGKRTTTPDLSADFHIYGCEFTPSTVTFYFDGKLVRTLDVTHVKVKGVMVPFELGDQNIWLTAIASPLGGTSAVDESQLPGTAEFDYVRFFEKN
jgi:beta-glucanase (GH16 family)